MQIETKFNIGDKAFASLVEGGKEKIVEIPIERIYIVVDADGMRTFYQCFGDNGRLYQFLECTLYTSEEEYQQLKKEYEQQKNGKRTNNKKEH